MFLSNMLKSCTSWMSFIKSESVYPEFVKPALLLDATVKIVSHCIQHSFPLPAPVSAPAGT